MEPTYGIKGVEVGVSSSPEGRRRKRACMRERVHWPASEHLARLDVSKVFARDVHDHKRIEVDVCLLGDGSRLGGAQSLGLCPACCGRQSASEDGGEDVLFPYGFH